MEDPRTLDTDWAEEAHRVETIQRQGVSEFSSYPTSLEKKKGGQVPRVPKVMKSASGMSVPSKTKGD